MSLEMGDTVQHVESHRKAPEVARRQRGGGSRTFIGVNRRKNGQDRAGTRSKFRIG